MQSNDVGVVITGSASCLGAATARHLAGPGLWGTLIDLADRPGAAPADETGLGFVRTYITRADDVASALDHAEAFGGPTRILVACAGLSSPAQVVDRDSAVRDWSVFRKVIEVNLVATFNMGSRVSGMSLPLAHAFAHLVEGLMRNPMSIGDLMRLNRASRMAAT